MKEKIKVTKEVFQKEFYPGSCRCCTFYNEKQDECEIEEEAKRVTLADGLEAGYDYADLTKMDCTAWDYMYTT